MRLNAGKEATFDAYEHVAVPMSRATARNRCLELEGVDSKTERCPSGLSSTLGNRTALITVDRERQSSPARDRLDGSRVPAVIRPCSTALRSDV
jgi:hypothetical protein